MNFYPFDSKSIVFMTDILNTNLLILNKFNSNLEKIYPLIKRF